MLLRIVLPSNGEKMIFWDKSETMWMLSDDERILTKAEWDCLRIGLASLRDSIEEDIFGQSDFATTGVQVFDRLTASQKLAMLANTCEALTFPNVPAPQLNAVNEGTIAALLQWTGHKVVREFYYNDAGVQIANLGESVQARVREARRRAWPGAHRVTA